MRLEDSLQCFLEKYLPNSPPFAKPTRYALFSGGKRLRPSALFLIAEICGASSQNVIAPAACLECIHTYSLIHDDLPCMDNDTQRRGKPTLHIAYGEATALMTGNLLLGIAFDILLETPYSFELTKILTKAIGEKGLLGGQALDLAHSKEIEKLFRWKTGALFGAAFEMGAVLGEQPAEIQELFRVLGEEFGILYQIVDDFDDQNFATTEKKYFELIEKSQQNCTVFLTKLKRHLDISTLEQWLNKTSSKLPSLAL